MIKVTIKRFDATLPLPEYKTAGAAAMDLCARLSVEIAPHSVGYVPLNIALEIPDEHYVQISARSSLHKKGLLVANGIGIGDHDFRGDGDEYVAALLNFTDQKVVIEKGERLVQMIVLKREKVVLSEVTHFGTPDRGGFGSTGK